MPPALRSACLALLVAGTAQAQPGFDCQVPVPPQPASWTVLGNGQPGSVSRAQLQAALATGGAIRLAIGASVLNVDQELVVSRETLLDGNGAILSGTGSGRILRVTNPGNATYTFTLLNTTVRGGRTPAGSGAGLFKPSGGPWQAVSIRVFDSRFTDNHAIQTAQDDGGGGLYVIGADALELVRTTIDNNRGANGGGVYTLGTRTINLFDTVLAGNQATGTGGNPGNGGNGGGLGVDGAQRNINLCRSRLIDNTANAYGGGLFTVAYDQASFVRLRQTTVQGNNSVGSSNAHTGGVYLQGGPFEIDASTFRDNQAAGYGGLALFDHGGTTTAGLIVNSTFTGNLARTGLGGAINMAASGGVTIQNTTIANNRADCAVCFAGGIANAAGRPLTLRNVLFRNNTGGNAFNPWTLLNAPVAGSNNIQWPQVRPGSGGQQEAPVTAGAIHADIALGPPADNGGPTQTLALPFPSPAIDAGTGTGTPALDQRGRPRHGAPDIGAYEREPDLLFADGFQ
ncbi:MAG: right-handed parallel beta-helix repeat-containing protein [Xanthomonadales bacterium]|nr:right-handed parallel beta-helix repeat-containing protein [Xanthomonadales bacterium]